MAKNKQIPELLKNQRKPAVLLGEPQSRGNENLQKTLIFYSFRVLTIEKWQH